MNSNDKSGKDAVAFSGGIPIQRVVEPRHEPPGTGLAAQTSRDGHASTIVPEPVWPRVFPGL